MKFFLLYLISIYLLVGSRAHATDCLGPKTSEYALVYLHGIDSREPGTLELENRRRLQSLSSTLNVGVALPRAKNECPNNDANLCWGFGDWEDEIVASVIKSARKAVHDCFPRAKKKVLVGFSNGGFAVNHILRACFASGFDLLVSAGAGGSTPRSERNDLDGCTPLRLFAGIRDKYNYQDIKNFANWLASKHADVETIEYQDNHVLPESELISFIGLWIEK